MSDNVCNTVHNTSCFDESDTDSSFLSQRDNSMNEDALPNIKPQRTQAKDNITQERVNTMILRQSNSQRDKWSDDSKGESTESEEERHSCISENQKFENVGSKCDESVDNQTCSKILKNQSCDKSSSLKILMDSNSNQVEQARKQDEAEVID